MSGVIVYPLESDLVRPGDKIVDTLSKTLSQARIRLRNKDVVAVSSKIIGISENRIKRLDSVRPTNKAAILGQRYSMDPRFVQVILNEADQVVGGVRGALLTLKDGDAVANAGVDQKNAPRKSVVLWPRRPDTTARKLRAAIKRRFGKDVGIVIVDSRVTPLRLGTTGISIGVAGFQPTRDLRGVSDLSSRKIRITVQSIADGIAAASQLVMGEAAERSPFVLLREVPARFESGWGIRSAKLSWGQCLYMSQIRRPRSAAS